MSIPDTINRQNIIDAAKAYDENIISHSFRHSTTYDVLINGHRYPPKAIIGIAASYHLNGEPLAPHDFNGGRGTQCFNILESNGFVIVLKNEEFIYPDEISENIAHTEGSVKQVMINRYERDSNARDKCIEYYGLKCQVCNFDFEQAYGDLGAGFIHVHHIIPISEVGVEYEVNPIDDLRPVCPNCHAMLHKKSPPYSIGRLKKIMQNQVD